MLRIILTLRDREILSGLSTFDSEGVHYSSRLTEDWVNTMEFLGLVQTQKTRYGFCPILPSQWKIRTDPAIAFLLMERNDSDSDVPWIVEGNGRKTLILFPE